MKLTVVLKLLPSPGQAPALLETLERANAAANEISRIAWETGTFGQFALHRLCYAPIKASSGLSAQVIVRIIAKVADAYKLDKKTVRTFRPHGSIAYDERILRYGDGFVSIWTTAGRAKIPFVCGERQRALLACQQGESDLAYRDGIFYLHATVNYTEPPEGEPDGYLGIDLGIVSIASDSDGVRYSGKQLLGLRARYAHLRAKLQRKGTRAAKRLLRKRHRKEQRMQTNINHTISKQIVARAQGTARGIAVEDLTGIRQRVRLRRAQRRVHDSWAFAQLRLFLTYKVRMAGVRLVAVDPRNTSRECLACGHVAKENRRSQAAYLCVVCGYAAHADTNAASVIARRAVVMLPNLASATGGSVAAKSCLL